MGDRLTTLVGIKREKDISSDVVDDEEDEEPTNLDVLKDELKSREATPAAQQHDETENEAQREKDDKQEEEPELEQEPEPEATPLDPTVFEVINKEANTERVFLQGIDFEEPDNRFTESELRSSVFDSLKTIEKLQNDLMYFILFHSNLDRRKFVIYIIVFKAELKKGLKRRKKRQRRWKYNWKMHLKEIGN